MRSVKHLNFIWAFILSFFLVFGCDDGSSDDSKDAPPDTTAPTVDSVSPEDAETGIAVNASIVITFDETMDTTATEAAVTIDPSVTGVSYAWSSANTVLTISHNDFIEMTPYTVTVGTGASDDSGNALESEYEFSFETGDFTAPEVDSTTPANGDEDVAVDADIVINFSEAMDTAPTEAAITIDPALTGVSYAWTNADATLTISHDAFAADGMEYTVTVGMGAEDENSVSLASPYIFSFESEDAVLPEVDSVEPEDAESDIAVNAPIVITFTETMDTTATEASITIDPAVTGISYAWSSSDSVLTISHDDFSEMTPYTVTVGTGASDDSGNTLATEYEFDFTTGDFTAPTVEVTTPATTSNVAVDSPIVLTFSEQMNTTATEAALNISPALSNPVYIWSSGDTVLTITHDDFPDDGTEYTITVGTGAEDSNSVSLASEYEFSFRPIDNVAPGEAGDFIATMAGGGGISVSWTEPADSDFDHVIISWLPADGAGSTTVSAGTTTCDITGLSNGTEYAISIRAVDTSGNESGSTSTEEITPPAASVPVHYIDDEAGLAAINDSTDNYDDYYVLMTDLDLTAYSNWTPLGNGTPYFSGTFDGNGHTISNLTITSGSEVGLFERVATSGIVKDLMLSAISVTGSSYVGGLVSWNFGTLENCTVSGNMDGNLYTGGIAGTNGGGGYIVDCVSSVNVTSDDSSDTQCGGLVGANWAYITGCSASGTVTGRSSTGGLVGYNTSFGTIENSYASGTVLGWDNTGGLVGNTAGNISRCYAAGDVFADSDYAGGIAGYISGSPVIEDCYSLGSVDGTDYAGGIAGYLDGGTISTCYQIGAVYGDSYGYGLVGYNDEGTVGTYCFFNDDDNDDTEGTGLTLLQMQDDTNFTDWDFTDTWDIDSLINGGYPYLQGMEP